MLRSACDLGQIDFVNCLPITHILLKEKPELLSLVMGAPGNLNKQYRDKGLDLGAMSSHYFLEDGGFELFPNISISSQGAVGSVLFFCRGSVAELRQAKGASGNKIKIGVPQASASSVRLLHILLVECYDLVPDFVALADPRPDYPRPDQPSTSDQDLDGFLLFGDRALTIDHGMEQSGLIKDFERIDLGQWWFEKYHLPMVFGVWAARKSWIAKNPEDFAAISTYLADSYGKGLGPEFQAVVTEAALRTGLSPARMRQYYHHELDYTYTAEHAEGLQLYYDLCKKHDLL